MLAIVFALTLGVGLASPAPAEIVCESESVPVRLSRTVYVLRHVTRCYHPPTEVDALQKRCDLLLTAYGEEEGRRRCRELIGERRFTP